MSEKTGEPEEPTDGTAITPAVGATERDPAPDDLVTVVEEIVMAPDDPEDVGPPIDIIADEEELLVSTPDATSPPADETLTTATDADRAAGGAGSKVSGLLRGVRGFFDPAFSGIDTRVLRNVCIVTFLLVIALLLGNQAGGALILASTLIPVLIVTLLTAHDVYERESPLLLAGVGLVGAAAGLLIGLLASWIVRAQWFDTGHLNFGAGGFGGNFAPGAAPWLVWLVAGLLLPAAIVAGLSAGPLLLRRWPQFANEVMDGMILAGISAAGLSIGLAAIFWWPMVLGDGPLMDVRDWTLTILGEVLLRPLVITLSGALIGAGVWRYMLNPNGSFMLLAPAVAGVLGIMVLWSGSLATQPGGIWPEFILTLALGVLVFGAYRRTLDVAIAADQASLGDTEGRIVCPSCHQVTPAGAFCARCGEKLPGAA